MKYTIKLLLLIIACNTMGRVFAQTNPSAVSLPFTLNSQSSATLPSGVAVHRFSSIPTTRTLSPATGDLPNQGSSPAYNAGGWYHLGTDGIGLLASGTNPAGAIVLAVNTTGLTNVTVSWICKTIKNQSARDNSIALQYRIGTSGNFTNVGTATTYSSMGHADGHTSSTLTEVLPAAAENQSVVQIRWIYWESNSVSGSRDKISVDDISVTASSGSGCMVPYGLAANNITTTDADLSWNAVSGATGYEYAVTTSITPPGSGTSTTALSYHVSGLSAGTNYYLHVRTACDVDNYSSWVTYAFSTEETSSEDSGFVVMTYNLLNYPGSTASVREPSFRTIMNDVQPDILVVQELSNSTGPASFLNNVLNYTTTTYSLGTFIDGYDSDNGIYYKTSQFQFIGNTPIHTSLRDINEFMLKYIPSGDTLIIFSAHLKAGNTTSDESERADEVDALRAVTDAMTPGKYFMVCGDFNLYGDWESAYQQLVTVGNNTDGKFNDLLNLSGTWNNAAYAIHHTQSPRTSSFGGGATGGMDDRFDMILFSDAIIQTGGFDIVPNTYKAYGNDGQHYNMALNTAPFTMYSATIASALHDASDHIPVIVRLKPSAHAKMYQPSSVEGLSHTIAHNLNVYPNPASGVVYISAKHGTLQTAALILSDAGGRTIRTIAVNAAATYAEISLNGIAPGVYYLQASGLQGAYKVMVR